MTTYAFNPTGVSGPNNIIGEIQALVPLASPQYAYLIPRFAPFFFDTLTVSITATAQGLGAFALNTPVVLTPYVDYFPALEFITASTACARGIYGAIRFADHKLAAQVTLSYLTLGGEWVQSTAAQNAVIAAQAFNPLVTSYETAFNVTDPFPAVTLPTQEQPLIGISSVISVLGDISNLLAVPPPPYSPINFESHITNYHNPHGDTAATFQLDQVPNWSVASTAEAQAGTLTNRFLTPALAAAVLGSSSGTLPASGSAYGIAKLNLGGQAGDGSDASKALTTAGLLTLKTASGSNGIKTLFAYERQILTFSLNPIPYPVLYHGTRCANWRDLIAAVQAFIGFSPIQANFKTNEIYLPYDMAAPSMTITATT